MIKSILFDLDGVLIEAKEIHYKTLNQAITEVVGEEYNIPYQEHLSIYDGLKTNDKLDLLSQRKGLPSQSHKQIWLRKQELTVDELVRLRPNEKLISLFSSLKQNYKLVCCSNSIKQTVHISLNKIGVYGFFDFVLSNEDVNNPKPHPEIYWKAMSELGVLPEETLIIEDSPHGLLAAARSGANILRVIDPKDLSLSKIEDKICKVEKRTQYPPKWQGDKMNILIPMAGAGSRFEAAGYTFPKPLIDVNGTPMIQTVVENLNVEGTFIFVVQKSHRVKYNLDSMLNLIAPGCKIVEVDGVTQGAACTTLLAKEYIDNDQPLLMANSDQFLEWNSNEFMYKMQEQNAEGGIVTFTATHPKWSFAKIDDLGYVTEVAEKNPISNVATVGVYYWQKGSDYVKYAERMIEKNIRVNNEFYVCPVFNEAISDGKKIKTYQIEKMWGIGTPEDLTFFEENYYA
jgi:HAD superfamily hydrolase (TIGR01509 family)